MTITEPTTMNQSEPITARNSGAGGKTAQAVEKATASAHQQIDSAQGAAKPAVDQAAQGAHAAVDKASDMANRSAEAFDRKSEQLGEAKDEFARATEKYVHEHPMASIGMAVAAGFLLSRILSH